jgi:hypothetical protein
MTCHQGEALHAAMNGVELILDAVNKFVAFLLQ